MQHGEEGRRLDRGGFWIGKGGPEAREATTDRVADEGTRFPGRSGGGVVDKKITEKDKKAVDKGRRGFRPQEFHDGLRETLTPPASGDVGDVLSSGNIAEKHIAGEEERGREVVAVEEEVEAILRACVAVAAPAMIGDIEGREKAERRVAKAKGGTEEFALDVKEVMEARNRQGLVAKGSGGVVPGKGV